MKQSSQYQLHLGDSSEGGLRSTCALKQLFPAPRATTQSNPATSLKAKVLHLLGFQSGSIHTPAPLHMDEGWGNTTGESNSHKQKEGEKRKAGLGAWFSSFTP